MPSVYLKGLENLAPGSLARLEGEEFHHLARVTPRRLEEEILLNSGQGVMATAVRHASDKSSLTLKIISAQSFPAPEHPFAIAFALLKNRHDEIIVEKCTELGASAFFPLNSERSVRQPAPKTLDRFRKTALAAIKQCDNPWLPEVNEVRDIHDALVEIRKAGYEPVLCSERRPERWMADPGYAADVKPCFLIGPEGGWSEAEFRLFEDLEEICLGGLVTRAETAAIVAAAQWISCSRQRS